MASRHYVPLVPKEIFGVDEQRVPLRFKEPSVLEFSAGKNLTDFASAIVRLDQVRIVAAPGSGKSVRMPAEIVRAVGAVLIHVVPALNLAASLHDHVKTVVKDVPLHFQDEVLTDFPKSGIVYTSSFVMSLQCAYWRAYGLDPKVVLYMDECHESDCGTAMIRELRTQLPGVQKYVESSATYGTGDASSSFPPSRLPSSVKERTFTLPPAKEWDLNSPGVPWTLRKVNGDFLIFTDDETEAQILVSKFNQAGVMAFRATAKTRPADWLNMSKRPGVSGSSVCAFIVDYSYRSGFTFPTVTRIIDFAKVGYAMVENGRTIKRFRDLTRAELFQSINRGGRVAGMDCDYWRAPINVQNISVQLEGVEVHLSCVLRRMLGFSVGPILAGSAFATGKIPKNLRHIMRQDESLDRYVSEADWAEGAMVKEATPPGSPLRAPSVSDVSSVDSATRPVSVFSLGEEDYTKVVKEGVVDPLEFDKAKRRTLQGTIKVKNRDKGLPPVPSAGFVEALNGLDALSKLGRQELELDVGTYYMLHSEWGYTEARSGVFPNGVASILSAAGRFSVRDFLKGLPGETRSDAFSVAITDLNIWTAKYNATRKVIDSVSARIKDMVVHDTEAFNSWCSMTRDIFTGAESCIRNCFEVIMCAPPGAIRRADSALFASKESSYAVSMLFYLRYATANVPTLEEPPGFTDSLEFREVLDHAEPHGFGGRVSGRIVPKTLRQKVAAAIMGDGPVSVDAVVVSK